MQYNILCSTTLNRLYYEEIKSLYRTLWVHDGIITNDKFCCTRYLHLRLRASHRPQSACNNSLQAVRQADKGGNHETCMDGAPPPSATDRCATALGSGVSTPAPVRRPVE